MGGQPSKDQSVTDHLRDQAKFIKKIQEYLQKLEKMFLEWEKSHRAMSRAIDSFFLPGSTYRDPAVGIIQRMVCQSSSSCSPSSLLLSTLLFSLIHKHTLLFASAVGRFFPSPSVCLPFFSRRIASSSSVRLRLFLCMQPQIVAVERTAADLLKKAKSLERLMKERDELSRKVTSCSQRVDKLKKKEMRNPTPKLQSNVQEAETKLNAVTSQFKLKELEAQ
ncbi:hypothetical protein CSUI_003775 [Cystoisospora suis]|uniref:Uncharacterized protein n=1 Tax=Cystoisospora suis TaxID=483139 RepID=A0A2C6KZL8_9APIC|nr:hypothetical protein CSUI_003775 [Cystoisospora suis]